MRDAHVMAFKHRSLLAALDVCAALLHNSIQSLSARMFENNETVWTRNKELYVNTNKSTSYGGCKALPKPYQGFAWA